MSKKYPFNPAKYAAEVYQTDIVRYTEINLYSGEGEKPAPIILANVDLADLKPGDKLDPDKHREIIEEAERAHFFLEEAKKAIDKERLPKFADIYRESILKNTTFLIMRYLFDVYTSKLEEAFKDRDESELNKECPLLKYEGTSKDGEPKYAINFDLPDVDIAKTMFEKVEKFLSGIFNTAKKDGLDFCLDFAEWLWIHLTAWAMDEAYRTSSTDIHAFFNDTEWLKSNIGYLLSVYVQDLARWLVEALEEAMDIDRLDVDKLGNFLGLPRIFKETAKEEKKEMLAIPKKIKRPFNPGYLPFASHAAAHAARRAITLGNKWIIEAGNEWPTFDLSNRTRSVRGSAWLQPPEDVNPAFLYGPELEKWQAEMLEHARKLDDLTADIYDAILVEWLDKAQYPEQMVLITLDKIMEYRALEPMKDKDGRRKGYRREDKEKIDRRIMALSRVFVKFDEVTVKVEEPNGKQKQKTIQAEGPLLQIDVRYSEKKKDGKAEVLGYHCRPGLPVAMGLHGPGRDTAQIARLALEMDPYREKYEKRLLRYFSYLWRTRQKNGDYNRGVKVRTILEEIDLEVEKKNPNRTKERLEQALRTLKKRGALRHWEYEGADESIVGTRGWVEKWLDWRITAEPPAFIMDYYREKIDNPEPKRPALEAADLREAIRKTREARGLSIAQAAEEIGISKSMLSMIENGRAKIGPRVRPKIEKWLNQ